MPSIIKYVQDKYIEQKTFPQFKSGDNITVHYEIKEGSKTRMQSFKGVIIQRRGQKYTETFTVRKLSGEIGVERIFLINQPNIKNIEINNKGKVRRKRIFYFKKLKGKKARIRASKLD